MSGVLYGVGVGPGAPDLLTLRALEVLRQADVLALPRATPLSTSTAWSIIEPHLDPDAAQPRLWLTFPMSYDPARVRPAIAEACDRIGEHLARGRRVAFAVEGDPMLFSSFVYLLREVPRRWPAARVEVVPAVSSITAVPAALQRPLADGQQRIAVLPAAYGLDDLDDLLDRFDTVVLMKIGPSMDQLIDTLERKGLLACAAYVSRATMPQQRIEPDLRALRGQRGDCFAMVVVNRPDRAGILLGTTPPIPLPLAADDTPLAPLPLAADDTPSIPLPLAADDTPLVPLPLRGRARVGVLGPPSASPSPPPTTATPTNGAPAPIRSDAPDHPGAGWAIYAITRHGLAHARTLAERLPGAHLYVSHRLADQAPPDARPLPLPMGPLLAETFPAYHCHVFVISVGAVVRMIAPLLGDKKTDPAVVCVDDTARFSICVLSGHVGRGNQHAERVATLLGAAPVVTTASDALGTLTVDILGRELGWSLDDPDRNVTRGCAAVVNQAPVLFVQETGEPTFWPLDRALPPGVTYTTCLDGVDPSRWEMLLVATDRNLRRTHPACWERAVVYRPRSLILGLGCDRDTPAELVRRGVLGLLGEHGLAVASVRALATIDLKADEPALRALARDLDRPLVTFTAAELDRVEGIENPSETVRRYVGTRSVAEAAALLAAGAPRLLVPKQRYTEAGAGRSMTLAIARVPFGTRRTPPESAHATTDR